MSFKSYVAGKAAFLGKGIRRFVFPFVYTALITGVGIYGILSERNSDEVIRLILALAFGFFASILLTLLAERYPIKLNVYLLQALSLAAAAVCWLFMKDYTTDVYAVMGYIGITAAVVACIFFFLYDEANRDLLAPHLVKGFIFSYAVAGILQAGLTLCIVAVDAIIVDIPQMWKYIAILALIAGVLVAVNLFLSGVPRPGEPIVLPKVLRILMGTVALPIYLLLVLILFGGVLTGSFVGSLMMAGGTAIVLSLVNLVPTAVDYNPSSLAGQNAALLIGDKTPADLMPAFVICAVLIVVLLAVSTLVFNRKQL